MVIELETGLSENRLNLSLCKFFESSNSRKSRTQVTVQFKDAEFSVLERQELFGDVEFWASCGGLLGLLMGFSIT